jgi:NDP-sugar pyrophosphorylase family protein/Arc/MetJ-type ribon-helix-helix transcriptional regulator
MQKISLRVEDEVLQEVDSLVDHIRIKNRSQALKLLLKKALGKERVAVILSKGTDLPNQNLEKELRVSKAEYNLTAALNRTTLIEEQIRLLTGYGFAKIYVLTIDAVIKRIRQLLKDKMEITVHCLTIDNHMRTADALRLLKDKVHSPFLAVFGDIFPMADLGSIYEQQVEGTALCTIMLTPARVANAKGNVSVEGTRVTGFVEKPVQQQNLIVFEPVFAASPSIFDIEGSSLVYDVFPKLAKEGVLAGHLSSGYAVHYHSASDKKKIELLLNRGGIKDSPRQYSKAPVHKTTSLNNSSAEK